MHHLMATLQRAASLALAILLSFATALQAQTLVRDPDIEHGLRQLAAPVLTAAGLSPERVRVLVIQDRSLNAFVIDNQHILLHSGLIQKMERAEELQAVIAHEAAHIANGHLTRRVANYRAARGLAGFGLALAVAVAALSGRGDAGAAIGAGTSATALRLFFAHTRAEEASADQSALRYMATRNIDPTAMADVLEIFRGQEALSVGQQDPYVLTHPLTRDRIRAVDGYATAYADRSADDPSADYWFARVQGKLTAFTNAPGYTLRRVNRNDGSDIAVMRRAIAHHLTPKPDLAIAEINRLVSMRPNDPFVAELKGQILLESRRVGEAVNAYGRAVNMAPNNALILAGYGRALVALGTVDGARQALGPLERARSLDGRDPRMLRDLAVAYAKTGNNGMASLATAERYAVLGRLSDAKIHATRAEGLLPRGSRGWNRAQDVLNAARAAER